MLSSIGRITFLFWADIFAAYAMWVMMTYLTNVWKISLVRAAAIVNFFWGTVLMLPLAIQYLVDTIISNYWMLLVSSLAYSAGMGFLTMSTPTVLAGAMGTCSEYKPECIGEGQKILFYTALGLIAFGMSGHLVSIGGFMADQMTDSRAEQVSMRSAKLFFFSFCGVVLVPIIALIAFPYIKPWKIRFGIPAIFTVVATLVFLSGSCSYRRRKPLGSPLTAVFRVFVASALKLFYRIPRNASGLYERDNVDEIYVVQHTRSLRCLDKAAIILPDKTLEQQEGNRWRLCRVTEIEETKGLLRMIPICLTFIIPGVVSSIGLTYFLEQADHLNRKVGKLSVPLPILLLFYDIARTQFTNLYAKFLNSFGESQSKKYAPAIGFATSMVLAILCCITAAKVETRRLDVIRSHGLIDKPDDKIPMSMFWLLPQFLLLGGFDGVCEVSIACFFIDQFPPLLFKYVAHIFSGTLGLGTTGGVLSVYLVGIISERKGKQNWFQDTLNKSRLDNYYWVLAALTAANLVLFIVVAILYAFRDSRLENLEETEFEETDGPFEDDAKCCCFC